MRTTPSRFHAFIASAENEIREWSNANRHGGEPEGPTDQSSLERRHPTVMRTITLLWGHPELNQYFIKVSCGVDPDLSLEPEAMAEAMLLASLHQRICPHTPAKSVEEIYGRGTWGGAWKPARPRS
ncbi:MAG: hypothetical protein ACREBN_05970 [Burkholderiaceae bacterium]